MFNSEESYTKALHEITHQYGSIAHKSPVYNFNFTNYYEEEMGPNLKKQLLIFKREIEKVDLIKIKQQTTELEQKFSNNGKRTVNIDPGCLSETEFALASCKPKPFKEKLDGRTYAHTILTFANSEIKTFPHTFPEFRQKEIQLFLQQHKR